MNEYPRPLRPYEEFANSITAFLSLLLAIASIPFLVAPAFSNGNLHAIWAAATFGGTLVLLHSASTLYHSVNHVRLKHVCRVIDHSCIYFLIAGTYTPVALVSMRQGDTNVLFYTVWALAALGVAAEVFCFHRMRRVRMYHYFSMGILALISAHAIFGAVPGPCLALLMAGAAVYSVGVIFFTWKRLPYHHAVWHFFVFAGGLCHYIAISKYVVPIALI